VDIQSTEVAPKPKHRTPRAPLPRLGYTVDEARQVIGCGRSTVYELLALGKLKSVKVLSSTRITAESVHALFEAA